MSAEKPMELLLEFLLNLLLVMPGDSGRDGPAVRWTVVLVVVSLVAAGAVAWIYWP